LEIIFDLPFGFPINNIISLSFVVVCMGTGVFVTFVFWMPCIRAEEVFINFRRRGRLSLPP